jgi:hypothetical protein
MANWLWPIENKVSRALCLDSNNSTGTCASKAVDKNGRALTGGQDRPLWRRGRVMTASSDPSLTLEELIQVCDQIDAECDCPVMIGPDKIDYSKDAGDNKHSFVVDRPAVVAERDSHSFYPAPAPKLLSPDLCQGKCAHGDEHTVTRNTGHRKGTPRPGSRP